MSADNPQPLSALVASVQADVDAERAARAEWAELEAENLSLRHSLHALLQSQHNAHRLSLDVGGGGGSPALEQELLLLRTASFLASSSSLLRQQLSSAWQEQKALLVSSPDSGFTRDQQAELNYIFTALPSAPGDPPASAPCFTVSHQSPYAALPFPVERVSTEWRTVFPEDFGQGLGPGASDELEGVWDALQENRQLYEEWAGAASRSLGPSTASGSGLVSGSVPCNGEGDTVLSHAADHWGFLPDSGLHAQMLGLDHAVSEAPCYEFDDPDTPQNIVLEAPAAEGGEGPSAAAGGGRNIKCASLNKLLERVTHELYVDLNTRYVFLLTYHSFTSPATLLRKLKSRFHVPLPPNLGPRELHVFAHKRERIQIRVCSVLKNWLDEHWSDFADSEDLRAGLQALVSSMQESSGSGLTAQLARALAALLRKKEKTALGSAFLELGMGDAMGSSRTNSSTPRPKILCSSRLTLDNFNLAEVDDTELARQLTLLDFDKFKRIQPRECLNQNWSKPPAIKAVLAPNILAMISQFNRVSLWVEATILSHSDVRQRSKAYEKFIKIMNCLRALNNFNSLFAIYCGLSANPIHRLKRTKDGVSSKALKQFDEFKELFRPDKNSRNFRRLLQMSLTPCIPHLGIFLSDLTFTEDGNPDLLLNMINWNKRCKLAERIRWIKQYQSEGYNLDPAPVIQAYFQRQLKEDIDPERLWKLSKEIEPAVKETKP